MMRPATVRAAAGAAVLLFAAPVAAAPFAVRHQAPIAPYGVMLVQDARSLPPRQEAALVQAIQEQLQQQGFDPGPADGVYGGKTRQAIRAYQRKARLRVDGQPTKELLDHLNFATRAEAPPPPPSRGERPVERPVEPPSNARGGLVLDVQRELSVRGYYRSALDGVSGPGTKSAVRAFQRDAGLPVTGIVDERLLAELRIVDTKIRADRQR